MFLLFSFTSILMIVSREAEEEAASSAPTKFTGTRALKIENTITKES